MNSKQQKIYILSLAVIVFFGFAWLVGLFANYQFSSFIFPDAFSYQRAAGYLFNEGFKADEIRPFGYPIILGLPYLVGADTHLILTCSLVINFLFWIGSVLIIYRIGAKFLDNRSKLLYCLVFICSVTNIYMVFQTMSETMFIFVMLLFILNISEFALSGNANKLSAALFLVCFSATIRPINYYLALLFLLFCFVYFIRIRNITRIVLAFALFAVTIGLQFNIMHKRFGEHKLSYIQNNTAFYYLFATAEWMSNPGASTFNDFFSKRYHEVDSAMSRCTSDSAFPYADSVYASNIKKNITTNGWLVLKAYMNDIRENSTSGNSAILNLTGTDNTRLHEKAKIASYKISKYENVFFSVMLLVTVIISLILVLKSGLNIPALHIPALIAVAISLYYFLCSGISYYQGDRFNFISYPLIAFASLGTYKTAKKMFKKPKSLDA
jgi:hypothetical protein